MDNINFWGMSSYFIGKISGQMPGHRMHENLYFFVGNMYIM